MKTNLRRNGRPRYAASLLAGVGFLVLGNGARAAVSLDAALRDLASPSTEVVVRALDELAARGDAAVAPAIEALCDGRLVVGADGTVYVKAPKIDPLRNPVSGALVEPQPAGAREVEVNNEIRRVARPVLAQLKLRAPSEATRLAAAEELAERGSDEALSMLRAALRQEKSTKVREALALAVARFDLQSDDPARQLAGLAVAGKLGTPSLKGDSQPSGGAIRCQFLEVRREAMRVLAAIEVQQTWIPVVAGIVSRAQPGQYPVAGSSGVCR